MTDHSEELRGREPTPEGHHLPEPDAFPHVVMGRLALLLIFFAAATWASYAIGGVAGVFVGAMFLMFVVFPIALRRMSRSAQANRDHDLEEEREVEEQERLAAERLAAEQLAAEQLAARAPAPPPAEDRADVHSPGR